LLGPTGKPKCVVNSIWSFVSEASETVPFGLIVPDCQVEFVFQLGEPWLGRRPGELNWRALPRAFVQPMRRGCLELEIPPLAEIVAFRVSPVVATAIVGCPIADLWDLTISTDELLGADTKRIMEELAQARTTVAKRETIAAWIARRLEGCDGELPRLEAMFENLMWRYSGIRVSEAAAHLGLSVRTLRRRVSSATGLSPKEVQLGGRVLVACALLRNRPQCDIATVANEAGFHDQAQLTHVFRDRLGLTPGRLRAESIVHHERPPTEIGAPTRTLVGGRKRQADSSSRS
jgi:AraC-like DNA-binding protein